MSANLEKGEWVKGVAHWREGGTAYISVAFTWRMPEARRIAEYYRAIGCTRWNPILRGPWRFGYDESTEGEAVARAFRILKDVSPRRKQVYTMIGHEPFDVCMDRIRKVIDSGGEPYAQPFIKLNSLTKDPAIRHDWTAQKLRHVQRWVNRRIWRYAPFVDYDANIKTNGSKR